MHQHDKTYLRWQKNLCKKNESVWVYSLVRVLPEKMEESFMPYNAAKHQGAIQMVSLFFLRAGWIAIKVCKPF